MVLFRVQCLFGLLLELSRRVAVVVGFTLLTLFPNFFNTVFQRCLLIGLLMLLGAQFALIVRTDDC